MSSAVSIFIFWALFSSIFAETERPKDPGLIQEVHPNFDAIDGLICYQCRSNSSELQPLCDKTMFRLATVAEKYNMSLQCPHYQGAYCFTKVTQEGKFVETIRGCSGSTDKNGEMMKTGCMTTKKAVLCLCDTKFCNRAIGSFANIGVVFIFVIFAVIIA